MKSNPYSNKFSLRICFEIKGITVDEDGVPCPSGMQIDLGETEKEIDYDMLIKDINIPSILSSVGLDRIIKPEDVRVISPEEYDKLYGD